MMNTTSRFVWYQCGALFVFLILVFFMTSMDFPVPAYILMSALPFVFTLRYIKGKFVLLYYFVAGVYLLYGLLMQDPYATMTSFCTQYYQFMVLMWFYKNKSVQLGDTSLKKLVAVVLLMESFFGILTLATGKYLDSGMTIRIVAGYLPLGGNMSIAFIPLIIYGYFQDIRNRGYYIAVWALLLLWVVASGTRGYLILFVFPFVPVLLDYFFSRDQSLQQALAKFAVLCFAGVAVLVVFLCFGNQLENGLGRILRLHEGIGRRVKENRIALETFRSTSFRYQLFGMGFGGTAVDVQGYREAVGHAWGNSWGYAHYIVKKGICFHSFFGNTLILQGVLGCVMTFGVFLWGMQKLRLCNWRSSYEKACFVIYWISFFAILFFRWSCDCGIAEMIFFALVLNQLTLREASPRMEEKH